jgi:hypothetical protein
MSARNLQNLNLHKSKEIPKEKDIDGTFVFGGENNPVNVNGSVIKTLDDGNPKYFVIPSDPDDDKNSPTDFFDLVEGSSEDADKKKATGKLNKTKPNINVLLLFKYQKRGN